MAYMVKYRRALLVVLPVLAMILISNASAAAATSYVLTDEPSYEIPTFQPSLVKIHGNIANEEYATLSLTVRTPHNDYTTIVTHTDSTGSFFAIYAVKTDAPAGIYDITADYKGKEITTTFYVVREPRLG